MKKKHPNSSVQQGKTVRRKYDEEFKQQALMMIRNGQSVRSVAEALGISENILHHSRKIVGGQVAETMTATLVIEAVRPPQSVLSSLQAVGSGCRASLGTGDAKITRACVMNPSVAAKRHVSAP
jgi:transposase-like protein